MIKIKWKRILNLISKFKQSVKNGAIIKGTKTKLINNKKLNKIRKLKKLN